MKKLIFAFAFAASMQALAAAPRALTLTEILLRRSTDRIGTIELVGNESVASWCTGLGQGIDIGSFAAAREIEALSNGLYICQGEFVNTPSRPRIQIFGLRNCVSQDPDALKARCPN